MMIGETKTDTTVSKEESTVSFTSTKYAKKKTHRLFEKQTPIEFDDIRVVSSKGRQRKTPNGLCTWMEKLHGARYKTTEKESEFFLEEKTWLGYETSVHGMKPIRKK